MKAMLEKFAEKPESTEDEKLRDELNELLEKKTQIESEDTVEEMKDILIESVITLGR